MLIQSRRRFNLEWFFDLLQEQILNEQPFELVQDRVWKPILSRR